MAKSDGILLASLDRNICGFPVLFVCVYCPPEGSVYADDDIFTELEQIILDNNDGKEICLLGDLNARTAELIDYDIAKGKPAQVDDENEYEFLINKGFDLSRHSDDRRTNNYGHKLIDMCKSLGILIANGRLYNDKNKGAFTCKNASVVDYIICSPVLYSNIVFFNICEFNPLLSDVHCAVECHIKMYNVCDNTDNTDNTDTEHYDNESSCAVPKRPRWRRGFHDKYKDNLDVDEIADLETALVRISMSDTVSPEIVQDMCNRLVRILTESGKKTGSIKNDINRNKNGRKQAKRPWFNEECETKRAEFYRAKNGVRNNDPNYTIEDKKRASREYRNVLNKHYRLYYRNFNDKLRTLKSGDPKE